MEVVSSPVAVSVFSTGDMKESREISCHDVRHGIGNQKRSRLIGTHRHRREDNIEVSFIKKCLCVYADWIHLAEVKN
jgi:hypothetical protein